MICFTKKSLYDIQTKYHINKGDKGITIEKLLKMCVFIIF